MSPLNSCSSTTGVLPFNLRINFSLPLPPFGKSFSSVSSGKAYSSSWRIAFLARRYRSKSLCDLRRNSREITRRKAARHDRKNVNDDRMWKVDDRKQASIVCQFRSIWQGQFQFKTDGIYDCASSHIINGIHCPVAVRFASQS